MTLIFTPLEPDVPANEFHVKFSYEHGDAEQTTEYTKKVRLNRDAFERWMVKVEEVCDQIDICRSGGTELDDLEESAQAEGVSVPVELDSYAKMHMSNYYAAMRVQEILYFDEHGKAFRVKYKPSA